MYFISVQISDFTDAIPVNFARDNAESIIGNIQTLKLLNLIGINAESFKQFSDKANSL